MYKSTSTYWLQVAKLSAKNVNILLIPFFLISSFLKDGIRPFAIHLLFPVLHVKTDLSFTNNFVFIVILYGKRPYSICLFNTLRHDAVHSFISAPSDSQTTASTVLYDRLTHPPPSLPPHTTH